MININGSSYKGRNVSIVGGKVIIDGKHINTEDQKQITIVVEGDLESLDVDYCESIEVRGDANRVEFTSGSLDCRDVKGGVEMTSGKVFVKGNITGDIKSMSGNIDVGGNVVGDIRSTTGNIRCGNVKGDASSVHGNVKHS